MFESIQAKFKGQLLDDELSKMLYANDASVYQQRPAAVACPKDADDIRLLIELAINKQVGLIPRAAGTSLAGQVVGEGIVVDVSRFMNKVIEINGEFGWVRVQPGVVRDHLNQQLVAEGLFFGPETSTSNRATLGGMLGNNSCGANSILYGSVRDQVLEVSGFFADGSFGTLREVALDRVAIDDEPASTANRVLLETAQLLQSGGVSEGIRSQFPKATVTRRNTGYALDRLLDSMELKDAESPPSLNLCQLVAGSEGTLFFATEVKLQCHPMPPSQAVLFCPHFESLDQALQANALVASHFSDLRPSGSNSSWPQVFACELIDRFVLEGAARNRSQAKHLKYIQGQPAAVLIVDVRSDELAASQTFAEELKRELIAAKLGFAWPTFSGEAVAAIRNLRKAGLGVVANVKGDKKPVTVIEDMAAAVEDLQPFIKEVGQVLKRFNVSCVHYGHAGAGELHLRPLLDLKSPVGVQTFRELAGEVAGVVKRFGGSLSGEHGDGRLRGEFLQLMIGESNYRVLETVKKIWDPDGIFNPGKIIDAPSMTDALRFVENEQGQKQVAVQAATVFGFEESGGLLASAELCSGSGDCRKTQLSGGVMCPSYMATKDEKDTTRGRANVLRQVLSGTTEPGALADPCIREAMDLCLSCKGCKSECPSNVDVAKMKAEFQQAWHDKHGVPRQTARVASFTKSMQRAANWPRLTRTLLGNRVVASLLKRRLGFHPKRNLPLTHSITLRKWCSRHKPHGNSGKQGSVFLFADEFTNYVDVPVGIAAIGLLERLGFAVKLVEHKESGRVLISQGLLRNAKAVAESNVHSLSSAMQGNDFPLLGIEPSAILTLRDEYPDLVDRELRPKATELAERTFLIDEFISDLIERRLVSSESFEDTPKQIRLHGHCHQKALASMRDTIRMLALPRKYQVKLIRSGCCGMAGSFGFEKEHYDVSMQIGELVLFPAVRSEDSSTVIAAGGTSCRQQILDGTGRVALHPVQLLRDAWRE